MTHWTERYIGREWTPDFDCAALVQLVLREQYGRHIALPAGFDWRGTTPDTVASLARDFAVPTDTPQDGDGVLLRIRGHRRDIGSHVGVYVEVGGVAWLLHNVERMGVLFHPLDSVDRLQLEPVAIYRWIAN